MNDQIRIVINYFRLKKYLTGQLGYSDHAAISAINNIRKMEPEVRKAFLLWFVSGDLPNGDFFGINIENLMNYRDLNPVAAFLAVDWYIKEPSAAYSVLSMPLKDKDCELTDPADADDVKTDAIDEDVSDIS